MHDHGRQSSSTSGTVRVGLVEIRPALRSDLMDIRLCAQKAYAKYVERMDRDPAPIHAPFESQVAKGFVEIASCESEFAGYVVSYPDGDHVQLENIAVLPEYSGRGIGRLLIEHVEHSAKEAGYQAVELYTNEAMTENLAMYPKIGYIEVGRRQEAGFNRVYFRKQM